MAGSCSVSSMLRDEATVIPAGPERRDAPVAVGWTKRMSPYFQKSDGSLKEAAARPGGINPKKDAIAAPREAPHGDADTGAEGTDEGHLVNKRLRGEEQGLAGCLNQAPVSPSDVIPVQPPEVGHQLDGRDHGLKPKPIVALDAVPVRPCRSSARVSEKEKRESENAVKEQGLLSDQDSRESKERGRKEARSGARASKAIQSITLEELEKGVGHVGTVEGKGMVDGEHMVEEEKEKRTVSHEGPSVLGGRLDAGKQAAWGEEATGPEKEKASTKSGAGDIAGERTKKAAYWTREEEESFFSSLRQFGKNFEKIQAKVKSKDKEQVRHYYYRCIKRMNKLLQPGMILDISNPLVVNTAMLRWWQVRADVKGDITDLHRKPRKQKQFQTAFEKAFSADLQRKSKARQKQAASLVQQAAGESVPAQPALPNVPATVPLASQSHPVTAALAGRGALPVSSEIAPSCPLPRVVPSLVGSGKKTELGGPSSKSGPQQAQKAKDVAGKRKVRKAQAAGPTGGAKKGPLAGKATSKEGGPRQKGAPTGRQQSVGAKKGGGATPGSKRGRTEDRGKTGKTDSAAKRVKGRGKGAGEVINDVGSAPEASSAPSHGPGCTRKGNREEQPGATHSLNGLAEAAAHLERLDAGRSEQQLRGPGDPMGPGPCAGAQEAGAEEPPNRAGAPGGAGREPGAGKAEGTEAHAGGKLTLQLFPFDDETEERVKKAGFIPFIELSLKGRKSLASIAQHLVSKWSLDKPPDPLSNVAPSPLAGCTVRLLPNIDRGEAVAGVSWGLADKSVAAAEVFALVGKPEIFRLKYCLLPRTPPQLGGTPGEVPPPHSHGTGRPQAQSLDSSHNPAAARPSSPPRLSSVASPSYQPGLLRGRPPAESPAARQYGMTSPRQFMPSPLRGHAAVDASSHRAFSWAADEAGDALGRAWGPGAPRYMHVSNNAPLGRGPAGENSGGFGEGLGREVCGDRGSEEQGGMPTAVGGGGWLDDVEGVSISGFLNSDGSRGTPFLEANRSRSNLGFASPTFAPLFLSPEHPSRSAFRAPAARVPAHPRPRSRLTEATALLGTSLEDQRGHPLDLEPREAPAEACLPFASASRHGGGPPAGPAVWGGGEESVALPFKDLGPSDSFSGLAPILDNFGLAISTDGFDVQAWDKCGATWSSRSRFSASPGGASGARAEGCKRSPGQPLEVRAEGREGGKMAKQGSHREAEGPYEQSVDEADQLRVVEGAPQEERDPMKVRPDPDLYWGNSLGAFEEQRPQPLSYGAAAPDDFLLRAPTPGDIPFGDSFLLQALESSNDGFLLSTGEAGGKKAARRGAARRASMCSLGRSKSSGDLVSPAKRKLDTMGNEGTETESEMQPDERYHRDASAEPRPESGAGRPGGAARQGPQRGSQSTSRQEQQPAPGQDPAQRQSTKSLRGRSRSPTGGGAAPFQLSKAVLSEPGQKRDGAPPPAVKAAKPFMALFPSLPGQLTEEELVPPLGAASNGPPNSHASVNGSSPPETGLLFSQPEKEKDKAKERLSKRKAKAKPKGDGSSKLQKKETDQLQLGKRAAELSQANKAAAAAINSCFGKSPFARPSWQDAK